jgi:hypothetical protein
VADYREAFVGIDVAKLRNAIAIADSGREGEVRFFGEVDASDQSMHRIIQRIAGRFDRVHFCYEAGPTGYGLYRLIRSLGHECMVVAPSLIPRKPGDRVKTNRRDALALDLQTSAKGRREEAIPPGASTAKGARDRLEGADPADDPISDVERPGQEDNGGLHSDRPRAGRLHVGRCKGGAGDQA